MAEAARQLGVAHSAYRMWELGVAKPDANRWRKLSEWLGVPIVTLLREEGILTRDDEKQLLGTERKIVGLPLSEIEAIELDEGRAFFKDVEEPVERMKREGLIDDDEAATTFSRLEKVKRAHGVAGSSEGRGRKRKARVR
jgi:transcriptional regulator with XRE-family HTH domain